MEEHFTLTKDQRRTANAAGKKDYTGSCLRYVHIRKGLIEACDGHILVQKKIDYGGEEILFDADSFKKLKDSKVLRGVSFIKQEEESPSGKTYLSIGQESIILRVQEGDYPKTDQLIPSGEPVFKIDLSRMVLKKLILALDDNNAPIQFSFYGGVNPVKIEVPSEDTVAILMPVAPRE